MKTLVLFSVLALLAIQNLANPLPKATEESNDEEQPGIQDQDVPTFNGVPGGSDLPPSAKKDLCVEYCRNFLFWKRAWCMTTCIKS
ncbi:alpha-defensin 20-like [Mesocricetus auratus]|uniref:Alpha-defensin 20-like n=1 Tax=Mesocricetus auratus TaxID=10036 RepID=A0ABM2WEX9_MESAU|nr:alpha-defensin 20-like [Mesocricetus auratus]